MTLNNLDQLNNVATKENQTVFLTSKEGIAAFDSFFQGIHPDRFGIVPNALTATVIILDKGNGTEDVFYNFFDGYNSLVTEVWSHR